MSSVAFWCGVTLAVAGAALLHLAAPHQVAVPRLRRRRAPALLGALSLAAAGIVLAGPLSGAAAVMTLGTILMLLWSVPPLAIAWMRRRGA